MIMAYIFTKKIIAEAPNYFISKGYLMFELGINEAKSVKQIMQKDFENIEIFKDLADIERVIVGQLK